MFKQFASFHLGNVVTPITEILVCMFLISTHSITNIEIIIIGVIVITVH